MDTKTKGAWLIHHANKLAQVTATGDFEQIRTAGKAGTLLSTLAASEQQSALTNEQVQGLANASGINNLELKSLLGELASRHLVSLGNAGLDVIGVATLAVLQHTSNLFDSLGPSLKEQAALDVAEQTSIEPLKSTEVEQYLGDKFKLVAGDVSELLHDAEKIGFLDAEPLDPQTRYYFNGNIFRRENAAKLQRVLDSLSTQEAAAVSNVDGMLRQKGCLELAEVVKILGQTVFDKLQSVALYDVNAVSNSSETIKYVTRPAAFSKYGDPLNDDAFDLAKMFVASLSYGLQRSPPNRGRITMLTRLVGALVAGVKIGPASAIGEDYRALEMKRVVRITPDGSSGRFYMELLKKEVGELALQVLQQGDASERSLPHFPGSAAARYSGPEDQRVITRKRQTPPSKAQTAAILNTLRTGKVLK